MNEVPRRQRTRREGDFETGLDEEDHLDLRVWLRLLTCTNLIEKMVRQNLRIKFDTTLPRFDAMAQLERAGGVMTMQDLSHRMMITSGNLTAIIDRLGEEKLVSRQPSPDDRRVMHVHLTAAGKQALSRMIPEHNAWISDALAGVNRDDLTSIYELLGSVKKAAGRPRRESA